MISKHLRLDKSTETGEIATIHAFIRETQGDVNDAADTVHYGPSTSNKVQYVISLVLSQIELKWLFIT